jgi:hypothetical protein
MKLIRLLLLFVLSLTLPVSGLAATGTTGECLMVSSAMMEMTDASPALSAPMPKMEHCSRQQDASGKAKGRMECKFGAECKVGGVYHPAVPPSVSTPLPLAQTVLVPAAQLPISRTLNGVWRPPPAL